LWLLSLGVAGVCAGRPLEGDDSADGAKSVLSGVADAISGARTSTTTRAGLMSPATTHLPGGRSVASDLPSGVVDPPAAVTDSSHVANVTIASEGRGHLQ